MSRKEIRQKAWEVDGWAETVSKVSFTKESRRDDVTHCALTRRHS
jgi:hypothetical protein